MSDSPAVGYPIRAVAKLTGISIDALRAWERRYKAVVPNRTRRGRLYDAAQVRRLMLLRDVTKIGHSIGLDQVFKREQTDPQRSATVVTLDGSQPLPDEWFGYEGVDQVVIAGAPAETWQNPKTVEALERWVRLGGSLWIVSGTDAKAVLGKGKPLAMFAPGELAEDTASPSIGAIEAYPGGSLERLPAAKLTAPQWKNVIGRVELPVGGQQSDIPLVIHNPMGFGQVTYIGLDLHNPPFSEWAGRVKFLENLLARRATTDQSTAIHGANQAARLGLLTSAANSAGH